MFTFQIWVTCTVRIKVFFLQRAFCHEKRLLFKQNGEPLEDFWGSFKSFYQDILDDPSQSKWQQLRQREEKRIERYNKYVFILVLLIYPVIRIQGHHNAFNTSPVLHNKRCQSVGKYQSHNVHHMFFSQILDSLNDLTLWLFNSMFHQVIIQWNLSKPNPEKTENLAV